MSRELWKRGAVDLARAVREREVSATEVVEAHLARIAEANPAVNAVTLVLEEEARRAAAEVDRSLEEGRAPGPLAGVPMGVKENIDLLGSATTQGIPALAEALPPEESPHVAQLRAAGAIPIARTNLPDMALRWHSDSSLHGATRNPWNADRTPGGSSGGDAAALATGMVPLGLGNDYGGSLRVPSCFCGTTAIKPTLGRVAQADALTPGEQPPTVQLMSVQGPMARHVSDLRLALAAMSGPSARDPWHVPALLEAPRPEGPVRVGVCADPAGFGVTSPVASGVGAAAEALAGAGFEVEEIELPDVERAMELWAQLVTADIRELLLPVLKPIVSADAMRFLDAILEGFPSTGLAGYAAGLAERNAFARLWAQRFETYSLVLGPVCTTPPFPVGADLEDAIGTLRSLRLTVVVNLLGLPSLAVPVGVHEGLPQGAQLIGARFAESQCLDAGEAIESALGVFTPIG